MPVPADENSEQIEGLAGQMDGLAGGQQQTLLGDQNEVAKLENLVFWDIHCASLGNLQEQFKAFPKTSGGPRLDHSVWRTQRRPGQMPRLGTALPRVSIVGRPEAEPPQPSKETAT